MNRKGIRREPAASEAGTAPVQTGDPSRFLNRDLEWLEFNRRVLDMAADDYTRGETRDEARVLMRALIALRLGPQPLHTRNVMMELQEL